jgi:hypothetical protein
MVVGTFESIQIKDGKAWLIKEVWEENIDQYDQMIFSVNKVRYLICGGKLLQQP